jgi:hypothetical protein
VSGVMRILLMYIYYFLYFNAYVGEHGQRNCFPCVYIIKLRPLVGLMYSMVLDLVVSVLVQRWGANILNAVRIVLSLLRPLCTRQ